MAAGVAMSARAPRFGGWRLAWMTALLTLAPAALAGQSPWYPGGRAGAVVRLETGRTTPGLDARATVGRRQTPRVEITGAAGLLWFPRTETVLRFPSPQGSPVTQVRTDELAGPYLSMAAARRLSAGRAQVLLEAAVALGLLRERTTSTSTRPDIARPFDLTDWEVTPTWSLGTRLRLPGWGSLSGRPEVDARLSVITLVGDDFTPTLSLGLGWSWAAE